MKEHTLLRISVLHAIPIKENRSLKAIMVRNTLDLVDGIMSD